LAAVPLFGRCEPRDLRIVARHAEVSTIEAGSPLVRQGDEGDALFVLLAGSARVDRDGADVGLLGPGDYFGELALLDPAPRAATVTAVEGCEVAVLSVRMFRVLLREVPEIAAELLAQMARRVRDAGGDAPPTPEIASTDPA
jgi:CRP/FNR family transcriptional regulator